MGGWMDGVYTERSLLVFYGSLGWGVKNQDELKKTDLDPHTRDCFI